MPGQVSITGIDNTRPAHFVGLTTVSAPLHEMGRRAAHAVLGDPAHENCCRTGSRRARTTAPR